MNNDSVNAVAEHWRGAHGWGKDLATSSSLLLSSLNDQDVALAYAAVAELREQVDEITARLIAVKAIEEVQAQAVFRAKLEAAGHE